MKFWNPTCEFAKAAQLSELGSVEPSAGTCICITATPWDVPAGGKVTGKLDRTWRCWSAVAGHEPRVPR